MRTQAQRNYTARMLAEGKCGHHGIEKPCTRCRNTAKKASRNYYARNREQVKARIYAKRQKSEECSVDHTR